MVVFSFSLQSYESDYLLKYENYMNESIIMIV